MEDDWSRREVIVPKRGVLPSHVLERVGLVWMWGPQMRNTYPSVTPFRTVDTVNAAATAASIRALETIAITLENSQGDRWS